MLLLVIGCPVALKKMRPPGCVLRGSGSHGAAGVKAPACGVAMTPTAKTVLPVIAAVRLRAAISSVGESWSAYLHKTAWKP